MQKSNQVFRPLFGRKISNFSSLEFHDLIIEAQEFRNFGFSLNRTLRMAIMRKRALFDDVEQLTLMVKAYRSVVNKLSPAEVGFDSINLLR